MHEVWLTKEIKATLLATSFMAVVVLGATVAADGCGTAEAIFDCQSVCSRYRDCYDSGYDVDGCRQRCRTNSAKDPAVRDDADQCEACIGDKSCLSATFSCATTCGTIVP